MRILMIFAVLCFAALSAHAELVCANADVYYADTVRGAGSSANGSVVGVKRLVYKNKVVAAKEFYVVDARRGEITPDWAYSVDLSYQTIISTNDHARDQVFFAGLVVTDKTSGKAIVVERKVLCHNELGPHVVR